MPNLPRLRRPRPEPRPVPRRNGYLDTTALPAIRPAQTVDPLAEHIGDALAAYVVLHGDGGSAPAIGAPEFVAGYLRARGYGHTVREVAA